MPTIADAPQDLMERVNAFRPPRPARGQQVLYYPHASRSDQPEVAFVRAVGQRSLVLNINGQPRDGVKHIDDPRLELNADQRADGAWDFAENDRDIAARAARLTPQQHRVLLLMAEGKPNKLIAYEMQITEPTVKAHVTEILRKLGATSRTQAVIAAQRLSLEPVQKVTVAAEE